MNAAEEKAIRLLVHRLGSMGWACVKFWDGEETQRGVNPHGMTQDEAVALVASVDDGVLYFRRSVQTDAGAFLVRYGTVRTIPDHCRDGIEVINDHSVAHGFGDAMERVYQAWEAEHA